MQIFTLNIVPDKLKAVLNQINAFFKLLLTLVIFVLPIFGATATMLQAQQIGFGLSFGEGVILTNEGSGESTDGELNFNRLLSPPILVTGNDRVTVSLDEKQSGVVIFTIDAPARADVTITVTAPAGNKLTLDEENGSGTTPSIPFQIGWAYWNFGSAGMDLNAVLSPGEFPNAREVVSATGTNVPFMSATFPMVRSANRSSSGPPLPPPDPNYAGQPALTDSERARAFVLVYGSLGPAASDAQVGLYTGTIDIHAELSTYGGSEL